MLTRYGLAEVIAGYLNLPIRGHTKRWGKAYEISQAIIQVVKDGLLRGEKVSIEQVGVFSLRRRKRRSPTPVTMKVEGSRIPKYMGWYIKELPERYKVIFTPSKVLLRNLNNVDRISPPDQVS